MTHKDRLHTAALKFAAAHSVHQLALTGAYDRVGYAEDTAVELAEAELALLDAAFALCHVQPKTPEHVDETRRRAGG